MPGSYNTHEHPAESHAEELARQGTHAKGAHWGKLPPLWASSNPGRWQVLRPAFPSQSQKAAGAQSRAPLPAPLKEGTQQGTSPGQPTLKACSFKASAH